MALSIKSKLSLGIGVLFALLLTVSIAAFAFINILTAQTEDILKDNNISIRYCNEMLRALDDLHTDSNAMIRFEQSLRKQEDNITEKGENEATQKLRYHFEKVKAKQYTSRDIDSINRQLYVLTDINQSAIEHKNFSAIHTSHNARLWISVLTVLFVLVGFTLTVNIPSSIATPLRLLTEGIREISNKNYTKRIYLDNKDELGEMAGAFNSMAEKLYGYEHSNLSQLLFEKKRVETIINQMEDAVIGMDADNRILFINSTAAGLFHLKPDEVVGKYAPDIALYNDLLRTVLQHEKTRQPLKIVVDGKENYFSTDTRTVFNEGQQIGNVFTLKNITSFKELDISKTNLLATISHELKTPISSIKMSTKLIGDDRVGDLNTEQRELLGNINDDVERLLKLTGELLNMTQLETGKIQLKLQIINTRQIVDMALPAIQAQAQQKNINIKVSYDQVLPEVIADAEKTSWVLINLLNNAIKFSPERSDVLMHVGADGKSIRFSVQDFGPGIEENHAAHIFDRYYKVPGAAEKMGTGLGLSISKEFIEAQNGSLQLITKPGAGSTFFFLLPSGKV
ncbi:ATP-binding protein [Chitinophagaceae bacterium MMS25-I14]